jgi:signal transduction histidine kinase/CheY-like chemotaxis protein
MGHLSDTRLVVAVLVPSWHRLSVLVWFGVVVVALSIPAILANTGHDTSTFPPPNRLVYSIKIATICLLLLFVSLRNAAYTLRVGSRLKATELAAVALVDEKERCLAYVAHEIRTPLFAIINSLDLVLDEPSSLTPLQSRWLETARVSSDLLQKATQTFLDYSSLLNSNQSVSPTTVMSVHVLISTVTRIANCLVSAGVNIHSRVDPSVLAHTITAECTLIQQVLLNLVSNAAKLVTSGSIFILCELDTDLLLKFTVTDTAGGIEPERLLYLFRPFQLSASNTRPSSGLGLAISAAICRKLGGEIWVASTEIGTGSSICFTVGCKLSGLSDSSDAILVGGHDVLIDCSDPVVSKKTELFNLVARPIESVVSTQSAITKRSPLVNYRRSSPLSSTSQLSQTNSPAKGKLIELATPVKSVLNPIITRKRQCGNPIRVLFVDDNRVNCVVGKAMLEKLVIHDRTIECTTTSSGYLALSLLFNEDLVQPFHAIFLNQNMPWITGLQTYHLIRQQESHSCLETLPVCCVSAAMFDDKCHQMGYFIGKPFVLVDLLGVLTQMLLPKKAADPRTG